MLLVPALIQFSSQITMPQMRAQHRTIDGTLIHHCTTKVGPFYCAAAPTGGDRQRGEGCAGESRRKNS